MGQEFAFARKFRPTVAGRKDLHVDVFVDAEGMTAIALVHGGTSGRLSLVTDEGLRTSQILPEQSVRVTQDDIVRAIWAVVGKDVLPCIACCHPTSVANRQAAEHHKLADACVEYLGANLWDEATAWTVRDEQRTWSRKGQEVISGVLVLEPESEYDARMASASAA